jgi:hypothetical protein
VIVKAIDPCTVTYAPARRDSIANRAEHQVRA